MKESGNGPAVPFLQSLVDAMRKIADQTREEELAKLRAAVAERSAGIRSETEQRAAELHEMANTDLKGIADWEQGEIQRIRDDASTKVSARNATLDSQLAANTAAGEGAMTAIEARVDAFEVELTGFFTQLNDIQDPAALASALKRIPQAPSLTEAAAAPAGDTAPSPAAATVAEPEAAPTPEVVESAQPEPQPERPAIATVAESVATVADAPTSGNGVQERDEVAPAPGVATAVAEPVAEPEPEANVEQATVEAAVAEAPEVPAHTHETVAEATTQVLVTGLTSFGAITSFKQSLERVDGVSRVSLGLGTSGEFIFTAVHRDPFDLAAAIRSFEESAQFVASNGQLRVTVGSKA
ncbi:MAG TPA: hypothetical protein VL687_01120 [Methylomirabilota bacterium]|nr:hypothetical protein [Methylomirabilota bacterium]